jgi:hypothetical protein
MNIMITTPHNTQYYLIRFIIKCIQKIVYLTRRYVVKDYN